MSDFNLSIRNFRMKRVTTGRRDKTLGGNYCNVFTSSPTLQFSSKLTICTSHVALCTDPLLLSLHWPSLLHPFHHQTIRSLWAARMANTPLYHQLGRLSFSAVSIIGCIYLILCLVFLGYYHSSSYRDPTSLFFDPSRAYQKRYSSKLQTNCPSRGISCLRQQLSVSDERTPGAPSGVRGNSNVSSKG